jgi:hypothetical protein
MIAKLEIPRSLIGDRDAAGAVAKFLRDILEGGALGVADLEGRARTAGLLKDRKSISQAKLFKRAKRFLGIRSVRKGFGSRGEWFWL